MTGRHFDTLSQRDSLHTQTPLHTHTHNVRFNTQRFLQTDSCAHSHFDTQMLLLTDSFPHKRFYTEAQSAQKSWVPYAANSTSMYVLSYLTLEIPTQIATEARYHHAMKVHTDTFTHKRFYTQPLLETLVYTHALTHRCFYSQTVLHTDAFTQRREVHRKAGYHDAAKSTSYLISVWKFPHQLPQKLGTIMP